MFADLQGDIVELVALPASIAAVRPALREMRFRANAWLPAEIDLLRELFAEDLAVEEMAGRLGRPVSGVASKFYELGLRRNSTRPWNDFEDGEILRRYGADSAAAIAQDLGRGVPAVYMRAQLLGVAKEAQPPWTPWEDAQLRAGFEQGVAIPQLAALIGRTLAGTWTRASKLGVRHRFSTPDWTDEALARTLELANTGMLYRFIAEQLVEEGFPARSKVAIGQQLKKLGYGRGWGRSWSDDEQELIRRAYAGGDSLALLAWRLGRTSQSIRWKAKEMGLQGSHPRPNGFRRGPDWTEEEERLLRENYATMRGAPLATLIGRPIRAMYVHAFQLGLKSDWMRDYTADEERAFHIAWRNGLACADLADALGRKLPAICKKAQKMGLRFNDPARPSRPSRAHGLRSSRRAPTLAEILALEQTPSAPPPPLRIVATAADPAHSLARPRLAPPPEELAA